MDTALAPFFDDLDEVLDASHFVSRATGHGPMADRIGSGSFSGRDNELIALTAWMNGDDDGAIPGCNWKRWSWKIGADRHLRLRFTPSAAETDQDPLGKVWPAFPLGFRMWLRSTQDNVTWPKSRTL